MQSGEGETVHYTMRMKKNAKEKRENDVEGAEKSRALLLLSPIALV